jgi:hypothetical protein
VRRFLTAAAYVTVSAAVSLLVTRWVLSQHERRSVERTPSMAAATTNDRRDWRPAIGSRPAAVSDRAMSRPLVAAPQDPEADTRAFRHDLTDRFQREARDAAWAQDRERYLRGELDGYLAEAPESMAVDALECRRTTCLIRLEHADASAVEAFHSAVIRGHVLNKPDLLSEATGCSLHRFGDTVTEETIIIECGG